MKKETQLKLERLVKSRVAKILKEQQESSEVETVETPIEESKKLKLHNLIQKTVKKYLTEDHLSSREEQTEYICTALEGLSDENISEVYQYVEFLAENPGENEDKLEENK
jgi:hypothetical protein